MIAVRNLHKTFAGQPLFRGLDFSMEKKEIVALIGPSGSGKSTFLRCVNGLEPFQEGTVSVDEITIRAEVKAEHESNREAIRKIRRKVGMVFQKFNLFPHLTVLENIIEAPVRVLGIRRDEASDNAHALLRRINLETKTKRFPSELSGGEQQRVAIARALAMKPEGMLFDEPTSSLDPEMVGEVLGLIRELAVEGLTTVIATHEMDFARHAADRIVVFDHGEIIEEGVPSEIFREPRTERTRLFLRRILER